MVAKTRTSRNRLAACGAGDLSSPAHVVHLRLSLLELAGRPIVAMEALQTSLHVADEKPMKLA
jgi:hypothetical protein